MNLRRILRPPFGAPVLIVLAIATPLVGRAAEALAGDEVVALPPFIVEEATKGPPWRYAEMPGFEILSRCGDGMTRELAAAHARLHGLLALILPESLQVSFAVPKKLIFYDAALQPAASQEVIADMLGHQPKDAAAPVDPFPVGMRGMRYQPPPKRYSFMPNLRLWDTDAMAVFAIVEADATNLDRMALTSDYVAYLLKNRTPALPAWFVAGILSLHAQAEFRSNDLTLPTGLWISEADTEALKKDPKTAPTLLPLQDVLASPAPSRDEDGGLRLRIWASEATLFVRWALDGGDPARRDALWKWVERAGAEGSTEALFQECFGLSFAAAGEQLTAYLPVAVRKPLRLRLERSWKPPALRLRNASEEEIARIKGDWERLEIAFVRNKTPELAPKYLEQARRTLMRPYEHDERTPGLLAVLGLCEVDAGNDAGARGFLEAAAAGGVVRPRAWFELARLRFAESRAHPAAAGGKLSVEQAADVLTPLFRARSQLPPLAPVYELIASVWLDCAVKPTRGHLAVLDEGVRLFPRRVELVYRAAELCAQNGFAPEAATLVQLGLQIAPDAATRERFARLLPPELDALPAAPKD